MIYYPSERLLNFRDLGLWKSQDGHYIPPYVFLRSDVMKDKDEAVISFLKEHQVTTILDLRTVQVANTFPDSLKTEEGFFYHHISLDEGSNNTINTVPTTTLYCQMIEHHDAFKTIFQTIAHAPHGVVIHCTAGKDRTGVVVALLLDLLGVKESDIIYDYCLSTSLILKNYEEKRKKYPKTYCYLGESREEYIRGFLEVFRKQYQNAEQYLLHIGITEEEIQQIRQKAI